VGAVPEVAISEFVNGPVTFGVRRPVVLLPVSLVDQPGDPLYGIACHEFLHVRRRDWMYTVSEEFAGALLWFHPAVWWLLGQIRLVREQVVDHEVVALSEGREAYLDALLAMGSAPPQPDLAPATPFLRRRQLSSRIQSLLKEVTMSKGRLVSCYVLATAAVLATAWFAVGSFPLEASPLVQMQDAPPSGVIAVEVTPSLPEPVLSNLRARLAAFQGQPYRPESREEILRAAREVEATARIMRTEQTEMLDGSIAARFVVTANPGAPPLPSSRMPWGKIHIDVSRLPEPPQSAMRDRLAPYDGQPHTLALLAEVMRVSREVDAQARVGEVLHTPELTTLWITLAQNESGAPSPTTAGIQVSGADQNKKLISQVRPVYPPLARQARIQGTVRFTTVIDKEGRPKNLTLVGGHPLLVPAAQEAVRQWVYQPTLLNGQPVEVMTQIDLNFTLAGDSPPPAQ
jgi:TonB family protein